MKKILNHIEEGVSAVILFIMLALTFVNVIARYVFTASISFTEEITTSLFVLLCLLATAIVAKNQAHLGLSLVTDKMTPQNRNRVALAANLLGVVFSLVLMYTGVFMAISEYELKQISIALQWPEWIYGSFVPIGALFMVIRFTQAACDSYKKSKEANV